ncbi:hypothetical protein Ddye_000184 [Dipteronia dyeriana]|uniref:DNA-directed DNA polymerase family A palm domain-containing protein n=1 Tax=Dipteronia dyeriana TaxID=168575 RepID=A0AAD9XLU9_9ROSI|nr:hypothetical protein Ddye_000184 [Dipteronia dyeriana]
MLNFSIAYGMTPRGLAEGWKGSAVDVVMCAMLEISKNARLKELGWVLVLQVHDEVILEGPSESAEVAMAIVVECMSKPFNGKNILHVDLNVDAKCVQNCLKIFEDGAPVDLPWLENHLGLIKECKVNLEIRECIECRTTSDRPRLSSFGVVDMVENGEQNGKGVGSSVLKCGGSFVKSRDKRIVCWERKDIDKPIREG